MVAGAERAAYRIHGETCGGPDIYVPPNITNEYSNNEVHSAMSGVNFWPMDKGFIYDRSKPHSELWKHITLSYTSFQDAF